MTTRKGKDIQRVNPSSILDLKAELFKKSETFQREKDSFITTPEDGFIGGGKPFKVTKTQVSKPKQDPDAVETAGAELEASWVALQRKAKEYEGLKGVDTEEQGNSDVLVDFLQKEAQSTTHASSSSQDPWVEVTDELGRTRLIRSSASDKFKSRGQVFVASTGEAMVETMEAPSMISQDMLREQERQEWEKQAQQEHIPVSKDHFDSRKEIRTMGVGFYQFATSEQDRKEQMQQLNALRNETMDKRDRMGKLKQAKKEALEQRKRQILEKKNQMQVKRQKVEQESLQVDDLLSSLKR